MPRIVVSTLRSLLMTAFVLAALLGPLGFAAGARPVAVTTVAAAAIAEPAQVARLERGPL